MARRNIRSRPGLFGTVYYYDENGNPIGKSRPGLLEGTRVYTDRNGRYVGKSRPGFLAKEVFTDADHNHITSYDSLCGEVHFKNGTPVGHTSPDFFDSACTTLETENYFSEEGYCEEARLEKDCFGGQDEYYDAADENAESESADYEDYTLKTSQHRVGKNFSLFELCLLICMVIAFFYVIIH